MRIEPTVIRQIKQQTLRYFGHIMRENGIERTVLEGKMKCTRAKGSPRLAWIDNIIEWTGLTHSESVRKSGDCELWRNPTSKQTKLDDYEYAEHVLLKLYVINEPRL